MIPGATAAIGEVQSKGPIENVGGIGIGFKFQIRTIRCVIGEPSRELIGPAMVSSAIRALTTGPDAIKPLSVVILGLIEFLTVALEVENMQASIGQPHTQAKGPRSTFRTVRIGQLNVATDFIVETIIIDAVTPAS